MLSLMSYPHLRLHLDDWQCFQKHSSWPLLECGGWLSGVMNSFRGFVAKAFEYLNCSELEQTTPHGSQSSQNELCL